MRQLYLNLILLLLTINCIIAQNPNNHWQLGNNDVNFSTNPPIVSTLGNIDQYGNASISDDSGNLLFYTDGTKVWDSSHQIMENGADIGYYIADDIINHKNKQPAIILPNLGNDGQYLIITALREATLFGLLHGDILVYRVTTVDFNDKAFPLGKVISTYDLNNEYLNVGYYGPLTAVKNATGDGYFIIAHFYPSETTGGEFHAYKLDASGLDSNPIDTYISNYMGYVNYEDEGEFQSSSSEILKFTPNGMKLGGLTNNVYFHQGPNTTSYASHFYTLDFNNTTGVFSNFTLVQDFNTTGIDAIFDFDFSSDNNQVYLLSDEIYVKNLTNLSLPFRPLTEFGNSSSTPLGFKYIQRDRHGNILVSSNLAANNQNKYIHKIDNQNSYSNSSVVINSISLNNNTIGYLPQLISELVPPCPQDLTITQTVNAGGNDIQEAQNTITALNIVNATANAEYDAGISVTMNPGFHARAGSTFRAYIDGCTVPAPGPKGDKKSQEISRIGSQFEEDSKVIDLFPNPTKSSIQFISEDAMVAWEITNQVGNVRIGNKLDNEKTVDVDLSSYSTGVYFLKVIFADGEVQMKTIIKE